MAPGVVFEAEKKVVFFPPIDDDFLSMFKGEIIVSADAKIQFLNEQELVLDQFYADAKAQLSSLRDEVTKDETAAIPTDLSELAAANVFFPVTTESLKNKLAALRQKHGDFNNMMQKAFTDVEAAIAKSGKANIPEWFDLANAFEAAWNGSAPSLEPAISVGVP